ncbi:MAG: DUF1926 domain-containing protein [Deltaproteobacteria bacterium]|nr:DUF1926 domain-containing protein [Deltaproteobacteria bacterium]
MLSLVLAIHCHQPVGNFDHVFEMACNQSYQPILEILEENPLIRVGIHMSGSLLEWIEEHRPATLDLLGRLVERAQVELLSGGFFEPLLATIPVRDARGQVEMMNQYLESRFGYRPRGFWLTERIWDPGLPSVLADTGLCYTIVDDTHFYYAGLTPDAIYGPYVTEKEGKTLSLLATPMIMRYLIPFKPVEEVIGHLRHLEQAGKKVVVYGDDGEKFGLWPGTNEWVIQKGWLRSFFKAVAENADWLKTRTPGDVVDEMHPLGRIYLPQASYEEMTEWALPADRTEALEDMVKSLKEEGRWEEWRPFVRGGVWDNFLVKYDEANRMHKKMIFLSDALPRDSEGIEHLWRAQCNCAYWHGVFGGLYLGHLRRAVHQNLLRAQECLLREQGSHLDVQQADIDKDGEEEILVQTPVLSIGISPARGGGIFELGHVPLALNLGDVLTRRYEAYHRRVREIGREHKDGRHRAQSIHEIISAKDEGLEQVLVYDRYTRASFMDHFLPEGSSVEGYAANTYQELGDCVDGRYLVKEVSTEKDACVVALAREGQVGPTGVSIQKELRIGKQGEIQIQWKITCLNDPPVSCLFGSEWDLTLFSDRDSERFYLFNRTRRRDVWETGMEEDSTVFSLVNGPDGIITVFTFHRPVAVWFFPLMTVSMSEEGFERTYQGSSFLFVFPLVLAKGETSRFSCKMRIEQLESR